MAPIDRTKDRRGPCIHLHFRDGINRRANSNKALLAFVVVHAFDHLVVEQVGLAVGRYDRRCTPVVRTVARADRTGLSRGEARLNLYQVDEVAPIQGQLLHRLLRDHAAHRGTVSLQEWSCGGP